MKKANYLRRSAAALTAAVLAVASLPVLAASSAEYNTWTGYVLRDAAGRYLSVSGGTEGEGVQVGFYEADGVAPYNTWYFTETKLGVTIKSALSQGEYYLTENFRENRLELSTSAGTFELGEDGYLRGFRSGVESPIYAQVTPQAVTNLHMGDWNSDGVVDGLDLSQLRKAVQESGADMDFAQQAVGDTNGDGALNGADVQRLQQYLLGENVAMAEVRMPECSMVPAPADPPVTTTTTQETTPTTEITTTTTTTTTMPAITDAPRQDLTMADFPSDYTDAADWIWNNRIVAEKSTERRNTIFDQIDAGNGTINYVVRWQSYRTLTLEQRQQFEKLVSDCINGWNDWLKGWDGWKYDHIDVKIVGWAVLDKSVLQDLQPDEVVYDNLISDYDSTYDTSNGVDTIPDKLPSAPSEISRFDHFSDSSYNYPGGLDKRFDMYLWGTQGFPNIGGCGGDWGQRLSDTAYLNMLDGSGIHVLEHEIGHGFGMTDFYGGEGESNGFPPGGFPGGENSLMMAGSAMKITDFDGWMLRYMWSKIKDEDGRFS